MPARSPSRSTPTGISRPAPSPGLRRVAIVPWPNSWWASPRQAGVVAKEINADLVVVSHHHQTFLSRWWSGSTDTYLSDHLGCTLGIARNRVTEDAFSETLQERVES